MMSTVRNYFPSRPITSPRQRLLIILGGAAFFWMVGVTLALSGTPLLALAVLDNSIRGIIAGASMVATGTTMCASVYLWLTT